MPAVDGELLSGTSAGEPAPASIRSMGSRILFTGILAIGSAIAQSVETPSFEVASIKPTPHLRPSLSNNPGRWSCTNCSLYIVLTHAFRSFDWQLQVPDWTRTACFDVVAKLPEGAKSADLPLRLQNLLRDRFHMKTHTETREISGYELIVANGGPKIKAVTEPDPPPPSGPAVDADGYPNVPGGAGARQLNGRGRIQLRGHSMLVLVNYLAGPVGRPVFDATGLEGNYAVTLSFSWAAQVASDPTVDPGSMESGPNIFEAVERQLGLKLKPVKKRVEMTVIDHLDRAPIEN